MKCPKCGSEMEVDLDLDTLDDLDGWVCPQCGQKVSP